MVAEVNTSKQVFKNLSKLELEKHILKNKEGELTSTGAILVTTGTFTGRSPDDKFFVKDNLTQNTIDWGGFNHPISESFFDGLLEKMLTFASDKVLYVRDMYACASENHRLKLRIYSETAYHNYFAANMFIQPSEVELQYFEAEYLILHLPSFLANPIVDGTKNANFSIFNLSKKIILVGGTAYTGEIKKGIFSVYNYFFPQKSVLTLHASATKNQAGDTALFIGLSGTGKTTLSSDPTRILIGDDELLWDENGVFNIEGGCYAKTINLSKKNEPLIWNAIKEGALIENCTFKTNTNEVDYTDISLSQNTRVSYKLSHIPQVAIPSEGKHPNYIIFLTADAFGVLPPIAKLTHSQAVDFFLIGYTAKLAGTEMGVKEPKSTFSPCFGAPFMPLKSEVYAKLFKEKIEKYKPEIWLINTGWTGGGFGEGKRIEIPTTRSFVNDILTNKLTKSEFIIDENFGFEIPVTNLSEGNEIIIPKKTWKNQAAFDSKAKELALKFKEIIKKFSV
ncbi:MAG: phosphoenolpyruvate carboxykinase (ATP) [Bacteroidetes bacterium]|nr:MAG: phosphoenolpyruvate carboxykinase (ATP) [Bacteroidota bacterium]